ncbi:hypothetical protein G7046_g61 [Stylonectria norvegica]|nr:hypothetical protein G7046_g61 [Stylonectria norvegica]
MAPPDLAAHAGTPAGYGRSCTNCSRAKCKCILRPNGLDCERCHRLGKQCQPMATARKCVAKKGASSRTAQLEEKLDDLVSILRATQNPNQHALSAPTSTSTSASVPSYSPSPAFPSRLDSLANAATSSTPGAECAHNTVDALRCHPDFDTVSRHDGQGGTYKVPDINETWRLHEPTHAEAEVYLDKFRGWLEKFPFMVLPPETTAAILKKEKPFLWLCIMNITSMSVTQQQILKERVRQEVATRIVIGHERTMDILHGMLCFLTWATLNSGPATKPFLITFSQLALAVIYDMGLMRAPVEEQYFTVCFKVWGGRPPPAKLRTMEERRAVLSLWFLTSLCVLIPPRCNPFTDLGRITSFIGKMDSLRWTPHMEDCLDVLDRTKQEPSDVTLVAFIKLQLVCEEAQKLLVRDVMGEMGPAPTYIFKKGMLAKIKEIQESLPFALASSRELLPCYDLSTHLPGIAIIKAHALGAEVQVHSIGLFTQAIPDAQRVESMFTCLKSARAWFDVFFSIPLLDVPGSPFSLFIQLSQVQVALYRLTTSEDPCWDKDLVRNTADLLVILDQTIERFLAVDEAYNLKVDEVEPTLFVKGAKIMRNIKNSWEPALSRHLGSSLPTPNSQVMTSQSAEAANMPENMEIDPNALDFNDMTWMTDVFGPWEF